MLATVFCETIPATIAKLFSHKPVESPRDPLVLPKPEPSEGSDHVPGHTDVWLEILRPSGTQRETPTIHIVKIQKVVDATLDSRIFSGDSEVGECYELPYGRGPLGNVT